MIKFGIGMLTGLVLAGGFLAFGPVGLESKAKAAGKMASGKADNVRFDICQREFLDETHCFQNLTATQCVSLIKEKCGR